MKRTPQHSSDLRSKSSSQCGSAMVVSLMAVMVVFAACMGYLTISSGITKRQRRAIDDKQAFYLAEAGLAEAYAGLAMMKTGNVGTQAQPATIGNGLFWVEATDLGNNVTRLESTALHGTGRTSLGLSAQRKLVTPNSLGVFSNKDFIVNPNTFLDSYDSSLGTYGEQVAAGTNNQTIVGSNGNVDVSSGTEIKGDVIYGATGTADISGLATVTGVVSQRPAAMPLPLVEVPPFPQAAALAVRSATPLVLPPGDHSFPSLSVAGDSQVILTGPMIIVLEQLAVSNSGTLTFDNRGGPIDVFVTDTVNLASGSLASTVTDNPNMVTLQVSSAGKTVMLGASALFYGQIYAPLAEVKVLPSFEIFGNIIADSVDLSALARMHYDLNSIPSRRDVLPGMWTWEVLDIPDAVAMRGGDPFLLLGVDKNLLPAPSAAHADQQLVVTYLDSNGALQTYNGMESAFDWSLVTEVISGARDNLGFVAVPEELGGASGQALPLTMMEQLMVDMINSPLSSNQVSGLLLLAPSVTDPVLLAAVNRTPAMASSDLYAILEKLGPIMAGYPTATGSGPLSDEVLLGAIQQSSFAGKELSWALEQNSPLSQRVLDAALNRDPPLSTPERNTVLRAQ